MASITVKSLYLEWLADAIGRGRSAPSKSQEPERDLVLGYATGYDVADVAIFVRSLRAHFDGAVALVVDNNPELRAFLQAHNIEALDEPGRDDAKPSYWRPHPVVSRFAGAQNILLERPWIRNALLTDVRDVVFQGDPFVEPIETLEFFAESDVPLAQHAFNMKYLRALAGEGLTKLVLDQACICVGTVVGPREDLIRFCRLNLMLGAVPRSQLGGAFGADQAACNLAAHLGLIDCDVRCNHTRVSTIGMTSREQISFDGRSFINADGSLSPVVHQYDRHPDLMEAMWQHWAGDYQRRDRVQPRDFVSQFNRMKASIRKRTAERR